MTDTIVTTLQPRECFGSVLVSRGVVDAIPAPLIHRLLERHFINDWGDLHDEDVEANSACVNACYGRILSSYVWPDLREKVWIISYLQSDPELQQDPDYCNTCVLFPSKY
jgi:hypothetical protein